MQLGERVRKLRQERGLTQSQVAGEYMTRNMLSQIENGAASPSMKTLEYLAETLNVSVGCLLEDARGGSLQGARERLRKGDLTGALKAAGNAEGDEGHLLLARIHCELAWRCFCDGDITRAEEHANLSLSHNAKTLYRSGEIEMEMLRICAHSRMHEADAGQCVEKFKDFYDKYGWEAKNHLLRARYYLSCQQNQAAEREIWMITSLPETERAQYLLLRGNLAVRQEKYSTAVSYLKQVEDMDVSSLRMRRELYELMETAYRELQDYKQAYEYAAKQRKL